MIYVFQSFPEGEKVWLGCGEKDVDRYSEMETRFPCWRVVRDFWILGETCSWQAVPSVSNHSLIIIQQMNACWREGGSFRFYHKTDIDGRPIYIEQLGKLDLTELYKVTTPERQIQSLVVEYEKFQRDRLPICSELSGHLIETSCTIMDLKGVGLRSFYQVKSYVQEASAGTNLSFLHSRLLVCWSAAIVQFLRTTTPNQWVNST